MIAKLLTECKVAVKKKKKKWKYIKSLQSDVRAPAQKMMLGGGEQKPARRVISNDGQYMWIRPWQLNTK